MVVQLFRVLSWPAMVGVMSVVNFCFRKYRLSNLRVPVFNRVSFRASVRSHGMNVCLEKRRRKQKNKQASATFYNFDENDDVNDVNEEMIWQREYKNKKIYSSLTH